MEYLAQPSSVSIKKIKRFLKQLEDYPGINLKKLTECEKALDGIDGEIIGGDTLNNLNTFYQDEIQPLIKRNLNTQSFENFLKQDSSALTLQLEYYNSLSGFMSCDLSKQTYKESIARFCKNSEKNNQTALASIESLLTTTGYSKYERAAALRYLAMIYMMHEVNPMQSGNYHNIFVDNSANVNTLNRALGLTTEISELIVNLDRADKQALADALSNLKTGVKNKGRFLQKEKHRLLKNITHKTNQWQRLSFYSYLFNKPVDNKRNDQLLNCTRYTVSRCIEELSNNIGQDRDVFLKTVKEKKFRRTQWLIRYNQLSPRSRLIHAVAFFLQVLLVRIENFLLPQEVATWKKPIIQSGRIQKGYEEFQNSINVLTKKSPS
ncbi:MAG: hypothetical protein FJ161_04560 [Gammaproteobacteria bacterium]|nr:hypothetical protein [Gammaproteobacteria bacterium]